jgi:hypothetical protein
MKTVISTNFLLRRKALKEIYGILDIHTQTGTLSNENILDLKQLLAYETQF